MSKPLVTIVTPSYNQAQFLEEAMESVLSQDYPNLEYIVVDGGSTDGSVEIIRRYADRLAWWTSEPDRGQAAALNKGFARSTGEILGWLNSDDVLLPGSVSRAVEVLERDPELLLVFGGANVIDERSEPVTYAPPIEPDAAEMVRRCYFAVTQQGALFRRRALEVAGPLHEESYYLFDSEFSLRLVMTGRVARVDEPLGAYRFHPDSKTMTHSLQKAVDYVRLYDELFARDDLPPDVRAVEREGRSRAYLWAGELFYGGLDNRSARRSLLRGLWLRPRNLSRRILLLLLKSCIPRGVMWRARRMRATSSV